MRNKKSGGIFSGKGYYIALILGAVAIGVSGYLYYANANQDAAASNEDPAALVGAIQSDGTVATQPGTAATEGTTSTQPAKKPQKRVRPVSGETVVSYAMETLSYNQTTRDWRTHSGIDIAAQAGTEVCAAADGTVFALYADETMGMTLVLQHEGGYTTTYSALSEDVAVKAGDTVTAGQTIGQVGNTALMETAIGDHLHFAVSCNGQPMDPAEFLAD